LAEEDKFEVDIPLDWEGRLRARFETALDSVVNHK
jgi:hypothetical protein